MTTKAIIELILAKRADKKGRNNFTREEENGYLTACDTIIQDINKIEEILNERGIPNNDKEAIELIHKYFNIK